VTDGRDVFAPQMRRPVDAADGPPAAGLAPAPPELVQARLQLALEAARLGLWDWHVLSGAMDWDDRSLELFGTSRKRTTGQVGDLDPLIHPDDLPAVREALGAAVDSAGTIEVEFRVPQPDGSVRWLHGRGRALTDDAGRVVRMIGTNQDITARRRLVEEQVGDAQRMASLVAVAQVLGAAQSEQEVLHVVTRQGVELLGAQGAVLCLRERVPARGPDRLPAGGAPSGLLRVLATSFFDEQLRVEVAELPADAALPMVDAAVHGAVHFLADRAAALVLFPGAEELYARARTQASAAVPLRTGEDLVGSLSVAFEEEHAWREAERELVVAFSSLTGQALERIWAQEAERAATAAARRLSETLQRSLLTSPPVLEGLQIAVRYQPAAQEAQVGGDWYDAFVTPQGHTTLVIGDVAGHDRNAAAGMAQVRNLLRGIAQTLGQPPAAVLAALDRALAALDVPALATAVLAQVHSPPARSGATGTRVLRWSSAGHLPPLLLTRDGEARLLRTEADLLLGLAPQTPRADHEVPLEPRSTVLLYTDGLIERRGESLDNGLERLRRTAQELTGLAVEQLCDALLEQLGHDAEDDVALLVVYLT
jgi:PAS domain S-box-containing protein